MTPAQSQALQMLREAEAWALLTDVRFSGRNGLHDDIDKWLAAYPAQDRTGGG
jgi:hypothetical protein